MSLLLSPQHTIKFTIKAQGPWPTITGLARVALYEEIEEFLTAKRDSGRESAKVAATFLHKHLVSWDVKERDTDESTVTITPDVLRRLPHPILRDLLNIVQGYGPAQAEEKDEG